MFLHEFGEDFVLALELLLQGGDPAILVVAGTSGPGLERGGGVLEELLLPAIEHGGVDAVPITEVGDGGVLEEMEPKDGGLLLDGESFPSLLGHGRASARGCSLFEQTACPISTEAIHGTRSIPTPSGLRFVASERKRPRSIAWRSGSWVRLRLPEKWPRCRVACPLCVST